MIKQGLQTIGLILAAIWEFGIKGVQPWGPPPEDLVVWKPGYRGAFYVIYKRHRLYVAQDSVSQKWHYEIDGGPFVGGFDTAEDAENASIIAVDQI